MDNETISVHEGKIAVTESSVASVTAVITDKRSQLTLDDAIIKFFDNSTATGRDDINVTSTAISTNSTFQDFFNTINGWNISGMNFIFSAIILSCNF